MKAPRGGQAGFTLLEIVIASLLVSTVMAMLMAAFVNANRWISPEYNVAHYLARQKLEHLYEQVRQDWWDDSSADPQRRLHPDFNPPSRADETVTLDGVAYTRNYTVSAVAADGRDYRKAQVSVEWG